MHLQSSRPLLAPGLRVVRRGLDRIQVGLYDGRRVVLPRTDVTLRTLALLLERGPLEDSPATARVLEQLDRHGCLVRAPVPRLTGRKVAVLGRIAGPGLPVIDELFRAAGVDTTSEPHEADAVVALGVGELRRERLDPLLRRGTSHVVVRMVDGGAAVGPFVVPGKTACLRCIDAHQSTVDPDHVAVTTRYAEATARPRPDGMPDVVDPALATIALAWAVRDVVAHLAGAAPSTWSRTLFLGPDPTQRREERWLRHPMCACSFADDAFAPATGGS
jgi:bacteriocin biosynthesis cyclodehydratase domain-containing protein